MPPEPDCVFCRLVAGEIPSDPVLETDRVLAFRDVDPQAPTHVLVVPREHHADVGSLARAAPDVLAAVVRAAADVATREGLAGGSHRLVFNTGAAAGQSVFHVHGHVLGGRPLGWPPG